VALLTLGGIVAAVAWPDGSTTGTVPEATNGPVTPTATQPLPSPASTPAPPPAADVNMMLTDTLDPSYETFELVTVYSNGDQVGTVEVSTASPTTSLPVHATEGPVAYELDAQIFLLDDTQISCVGKGTIDAYEGATYALYISVVGSGCVASLE